MTKEIVKKAVELNAEIETRSQEAHECFKKSTAIVDYEKNMYDYSMGLRDYPDETVTISIRLDLLDNETRKDLGNAILSVGKYIIGVNHKLEKELEEL